MGNKTLRLGCTLLLASSLQACTSRGGGGGSGGQTPQTFVGIPQTAEQAMLKLTPAHRQMFETWKSALVKSCNTAQFLDAAAPQADDAVDLQALAQLTGGTPIITNEQGEAVILGTASPLTGSEDSHFSPADAVNAPLEDELDVELKRENMKCEIYLYGIKIYETQLASSVGVRSYFNPRSEITHLTVQSVLQPFSEIAVLNDPGIMKTISGQLAANTKSIELLAQRFSITNERAQKVFKVEAIDFPHSARLQQHQDVLWFNSQDPRLIGPSQTLQSIFGTNESSLDVEVRVLLPSTDWLIEKTPQKVAVFTSHLNIQPMSDAGTHRVDVGPLAFSSVSDPAAGEDSTCFINRTKILHGLSTASEHLDPTFDLASAPCRALGSDFENTIIHDGTLKAAFTVVLKSQQLNRQMEGWDTQLARYSVENLSDSQNLAGELDPQNESPLLQAISSMVDQVRADWSNYSNLDELKKEVYYLTIAWTSQGVTSDFKEIQKVILALDNTALAFPASTTKLVDGLINHPRDVQDDLNFAEKVETTYRTMALLAANKAAALGYSDWKSEYFDQILQKHLSKEDLAKWCERFAMVQEEIAMAPNVENVKPQVAALALKWITHDDLTRAALYRFVDAINRANDVLPESTQTLLNTLQTSSLKNEHETLEFAGSLTDDYRAAVRDFREKAQSAEQKEFAQQKLAHALQEKLSLEQIKSWNGTLDGIMAFKARELNRTGRELAYRNENQLNTIIQRALQETWTASDFEELEQLALLARYRVTCERHAGASAISLCASTDLFSRAQGKILDPAFAHRYGPLAVALVDAVEKMANPASVGLKAHVVDSVVGSSTPLWAHCAAEEFGTRATKLKSDLSEYVTTTDSEQLSQLTQAIELSLSDCSQ